MFEVAFPNSILILFRGQVSYFDRWACPSVEYPMWDTMTEY